MLQEFPGNGVLRRIPWTKDGVLARHLRETDSVLDLGCGPRSTLMHYRVARRVGVELYKPYIEEAHRLGTHDEILEVDVRALDFAPGAFDVVLAFDVFDHLEKDEALALIEQTKRWASREVIAIVTNGHEDPPLPDGSELQRHRCGFTLPELRSLGFKTWGLGLKVPGMNSRYALLDFAVRRLTFPLWPLGYYLPQAGYDVVAIHERVPAGEAA